MTDIRSGLEPIQWLDMSAWDSEPIPERKWAIRDRVPLNQAGLFSGEGGAGKIIIELDEERCPRDGQRLAWVNARARTSDLSWRRRRQRRIAYSACSHSQALRRDFQ